MTILICFLPLPRSNYAAPALCLSFFVVHTTVLRVPVLWGETTLGLLLT